MLLKMQQKSKFVYFIFLAKCKFSTLINYSTNMCRTSYEPTIILRWWIEKDKSIGGIQWFSIQNLFYSTRDHFWVPLSYLYYVHLCEQNILILKLRRLHASKKNLDFIALEKMQLIICKEENYETYIPRLFLSLQNSIAQSSSHPF